jgi:hypothetical protein
MEEHLAAQTQKAELAKAGFGAARRIGDTPVWLSLPSKLGSPYCENGKVAAGKGELDPRRALPGEFGKLSSLSSWDVTFEVMSGEPNKDQAPCYCYLGAKPVPNGSDPAKIADTIQQEMATVAGMDNISDAVEFPTKPASRTPWKKIRWEGKQEFYCGEKNGKAVFASMPGMFEVYVHEEAGFLVLIAGRAPKSVEESMLKEPEQSLANLAALIAGSVAVKR